MSLLAPDVCVACFHDGHPDAICTERDEFDGILTAECGCDEYITAEQRGQLIVQIQQEHA